MNMENLKIKIQNIIDDRYVQLLFFACIILYLPSLYYDFFFMDDDQHILNNIFIENDNKFNFVAPWIESKMAFTYNAWQMVHLFFGKDSASSYRILNIVFHFLNSLLIFELSKNIYSRISKNEQEISAAAFVSGLIFLVHPIQVESVVWISSFKGVLSAFFSFLSMYYFLKTDNLNSKSILSNKALALLFYLFSLFSKVTSIFSIVWVMLIKIINDGEKIGPAIKKNIVYLFVLSTFVYLHISQNIGKEFLSIGIKERLSVSLSSLFIALKNALLPTDLHLIYPYSLEWAQGNFSWIGIVLSLATILALLIVTFKISRIIFTFILGYFLLISVSTGFISFDYQHISILADRFSYLAIFPLGLLFGFIYFKYLPSRKFVTFAVIALISLSIYRVSQWRSGSTLVKNDIHKDSDFNLLSLYGSALVSDGKHSEALAIFDKQLEIRPHSQEVYSYIFEHIMNVGGFDSAIKNLGIIQDLSQSLYMPLHAANLAKFYAFIGDYEQSNRFLKIAKKQDNKANLGNLTPSTFKKYSLEFSRKRLLNHFTKKNDIEGIKFMIKAEE